MTIPMLVRAKAAEPRATGRNERDEREHLSNAHRISKVKAAKRSRRFPAFRVVSI